MTREEALTRYKAIRSREDYCEYLNEDMVDMAIQALSQEPCTDAVSREDAIEAVKQAIYNHDSAIMRLTELPSVNPQPCDDAISREDMLIDLANAIESDDSGWWTNKRILSALRNIEKLPSVTQKSGKWTLMYEPKSMAVCSECGKCAHMYRDKTSAFCPNCGAKMESEDKE